MSKNLVELIRRHHAEQAPSALDALKHAMDDHDVILPPSSFLEKSGTFINAERRFQIVEPAIEPPGSADDVRSIGEGPSTTAALAAAAG